MEGRDVMNARFGLERLLERLVAAMLLVLVAIVLLNVVLRLGFDKGIVATEELSRLMLVWLVMAGAVLAHARQEHLAMTGTVMRLSEPMRRIAAVIGVMLMMFCDALLLIGAWQQFHFSATDSFPVTGWPVSLVYLAGILAAALLFIISGWRLLSLLGGKMTAKQYFMPAAGNREGHDHAESRP
jgi:TRAP-type C4-dicarboxylate transport system permease small subunit